MRFELLFCCILRWLDNGCARKAMRESPRMQKNVIYPDFFLFVAKATLCVHMQHNKQDADQKGV